MRRFVTLAIGAVAGAMPAGVPAASGAAPRERLAVNDVSFATPRVGLVGAARCVAHVRRCTPVIARTDDGGAHFRITRRTGRPAYVGPLGLGPHVVAALPGVSFVLDHGRAYRSADAGLHLRRIELGGRVLALTASATGAFAVTRPCASRRGCAPRLWHSYDAGRHWWYVTIRDADRHTTLGFEPDAANAANAVLDYPLPSKGDAVARAGLLVTDDGGHSWVRRRHPCAQTYNGSHASTLDGRDIWMGCNETDGGGRMYRSLDGGRRWRRLVTRRIGSQGQDELAFGAAGGGFRFTWELAPIAPGVSVATTMKHGMQVTHDGGTTWGPPPSVYSGDGSGFAGIAHAGPRAAWVITPGFRLERTVDGAHSWRWLRSTGFPGP
jgi:hypothetical protein